MGTVLVAEAAGRRVNWEAATGAIRNPTARVIACDPIAFQRARGIRENVVATSALIQPEDMAEIDRRVAKQLDACRRADTLDAMTGHDVAFLAARTIAFQIVGFEKALAMAEKLVASTDQFVLVGDSRPVASEAYPSECQDLFDILDAWTRSEGIPCDRIAAPGEPVDTDRWASDLGPMVAAVAERLSRLRSRRVLAVRLYGDLRQRLSRLLRGAAVLPLILPDHASGTDLAAAGALAKAWSNRLDYLDEVPGAVRTLAVSRLRAAVAQELPLAFAWARAASRAVRRFKPHVVVQMEDISPSGRALASIGRAAGAWTVVVQHGLIGESLYGIHVMPAVASCHACWGDISRQWNLDHGAPEDSQIVVGNPMFDRYFQGGKSLPRPPEKAREVAFVSQPFVPLAPSESDFDRLEALMALLPFDERGVPIAIRPHPSEDRSRLKRLVDSVGFSKTQWDETLAATLRRPAVIVCKSSTAALEAMIYHRPIVLAALSGRGDPTELGREGATLVATTPSDLTSAVQSCLEDPVVLASLDSACSRVLPQFLNGMDGRAAERLAAALNDRLAGGKRNISPRNSPKDRSLSPAVSPTVRGRR